MLNYSKKKKMFIAKKYCYLMCLLFYGTPAARMLPFFLQDFFFKWYSTLALFQLLKVYFYIFLSDMALVLVCNLEKFCHFPLELFYMTVLHQSLNGTAVRTVMGLINANEVFLGFQTRSLRDYTCYLTSTLTHKYTRGLCQLIASQHVTI